MGKATFLILATLGLLSLTQADQPQCYYPDGTVAQGVSPCNTTAASSSCCDPRDSCTSTGLCLGASGWIYRSACTDKSWSSNACPQQCHLDPLTSNAYSSYTPIIPCSAGVVTGLYCCASSKGNCCSASFTLGNTGFAFKNGTDGVLAQTASTASATSTPSATVTVTATAGVSGVAGTATDTATSSTSSSSNIGVAIGAGVGIPLGILALGIIGFLIWRERKKSREADAQLASAQNNGVGWANMQDPQMQSGQMAWARTPETLDPAVPQYQYSRPSSGHMGTPQSQFANTWKMSEPQPAPQELPPQEVMHELPSRL